MLKQCTKNKIIAKDSILKLEKVRETEDNIVKDVRNLFRLKKKQPKE